MLETVKRESLLLDEMHVVLSQKDLLRVLSHQQSLVERKTTAPILSHVNLVAGNGCLSVTGTDLEMSLIERCPVDVLKEGQTTVSAHTLRDLVRKFPEDEPLTLMVSPEGLVLKNSFAQFVLPTMPSSEFPAIQEQELSCRFTIATEDFKQLIEDTRFAMSVEEARYALNSIYFHYHQEKWRAVATDAHRLALRSLSTQDPAIMSSPSILVGRKTIQEIYKLLEEAGPEISLALSPHQLSMSFGGCVFSSRLLEGQFPDYWQAIPQEHPYVVELDVKAFAESIDRVGMVSADKHRLVKCAFQHNEVLLSAYSQQYGSGFERVLIDYAGSEITIGFNPRYVLDICAHIKGNRLELFLKDGISPALFRDPKDDKVTFVLMPMRV